MFSCRVWLVDLESGKRTIVGENESGWSRPVAFLPDGNALVAGGEVATVWDIATLKERVTFTGHGRPGFLSSARVTALACAPNGSMVITGGWRDEVRLWDPATGSELASLETDDRRVVTSVAISPDGALMASTEWGETVKIWDTKARVALTTIKRPDDSYRFVTFSPDGRHLAIASSTHIEVWRVARRPVSGDAAAEGVIRGNPLVDLVGVVLRPFAGQWWGVVYGVAFSPNGEWLAAGGGVARLWDVKSWRSTPDFALGTVAVAFSPDNEMLVTAGSVGDVELWSLDRLRATLK